MDYPARLKFSATVSLALHAALLLLGGYRSVPDRIGVARVPDYLVLNLLPPAPQRHLTLVDPGAASDAPPTDTDLISSQNSRAQDESDQQGDTTRPAAEVLEETDQLGQPALAPAPVQMARVPDEPREPALEPAPEPATPTGAVPSTPSGAVAPAEGVQVVVSAPAVVPDVVPEEATSEPEPEPELEPEPEPEPPPQEREAVQMARAEVRPEPVPQDSRTTRSSEEGGAESFGFESFEANRHELGKYMLVIRNHVEREWRMSLQLRYSGASRAWAVLDCTIRPDGTLEHVSIVDSGTSAGYATLCKAAVERAAADFPPFPFDVPEIYRSQNLEVRWRFTYM